MCARNILCLLFLLICFFSNLFFCDASELTEICQKASLLPTYIRSYQFKTTQNLDFSNSDNKYDVSSVQIKEIWQSGVNIRVHSEIQPTTSTSNQKDKTGINNILFAYNGSIYQFLDFGLDAMSFSKRCQFPNLYWGPNHIMTPYLWFAEEPLNWSDLKDKEKWTKLFEKAHYEGKKIENDMTFEIISLPLPPPSTGTSKIYFAKELGYYPLKVEYSDKLMGGGTLDVKRYTFIEVDGQKTVFPLEIIIKAGTGTGTGTGIVISTVTSTIEESSIKVNHHIDEDLFTIPLSKVKKVYDIDYDEERKKLELSPFLEPLPFDNVDNIVTQPPNRTLQIIIILVVGNFIIILLIIFFIRRQRQKK